MIRVVVVDDQPVVRAGLARLLAAPDGFEIVGECDDGDEAVECVRNTQPDLVLMDVRMPRLDGVSATERLRALPDPPPIMMLTTFDDDDALLGAVRAGASGFVLKDTPAEALLAAARAVAAGAAWLDPKVAPKVLAAYGELARDRQEQVVTIDALTEREHTVLRLMARARTNGEIAAEIHVSEATVKTHVGSIFSKLGTRDRAAAIVFAFDHGLVTPGVAMDPATPPQD